MLHLINLGGQVLAASLNRAPGRKVRAPSPLSAGPTGRAQMGAGRASLVGRPKGGPIGSNPMLSQFEYHWPKIPICELWPAAPNSIWAPFLKKRASRPEGPSWAELANLNSSARTLRVWRPLCSAALRCPIPLCAILLHSARLAAGQWAEAAADSMSQRSENSTPLFLPTLGWPAELRNISVPRFLPDGRAFCKSAAVWWAQNYRSLARSLALDGSGAVEAAARSARAAHVSGKKFHYKIRWETLNGFARQLGQKLPLKWKCARLCRPPEAAAPICKWQRAAKTETRSTGAGHSSSPPAYSRCRCSRGAICIGRKGCLLLTRRRPTQCGKKWPRAPI